MVVMKLALEHVRPMRVGAEAQWMRRNDEAYSPVKFQNNPQHLRILASEMPATRLVLIVPKVEVVQVRPEIFAYTPDLVIQPGLGRKPARRENNLDRSSPEASGKEGGSQFFCLRIRCGQSKIFRISRAFWSSTPAPAIQAPARRFFCEPGGDSILSNSVLARAAARTTKAWRRFA